MEHYSIKIKDILETGFSLKKLRGDLFEYLKWMNYSMNDDDEFCLSVPNVDSGESIQQLISQKDTIHIIRYSVEYKFNAGLHYYLTVGIGKLIEHEKDNGLFTIEKCFAELSYNDDFTFFNAELYITNLNKP